MRIYCWPSEVCGAISPKASGVVFASEWVGAGGVFFGGGLHPFPAGWRKVQRSRNAFQGGGELHGFHDYQVLWLGCGFGSIVA